jgi:hypothetical protein
VRVIWFRLALLLVGTAAFVAAAGPVLETRLRAPEGIGRAYLRAVEAGDIDAAMETIDPAQRDVQRERVEWQAHNRYTIVTLVLGRPSVLDRATGRVDDPAWVTVLADVTTVSGERWRSTSTAPLVERDGVWYLARPLFA